MHNSRSTSGFWDTFTTSLLRELQPCSLSTNHTYDAYHATNGIRNTTESIGRDAKKLPTDHNSGPEIQTNARTITIRDCTFWILSNYVKTRAQEICSSDSDVVQTKRQKDPTVNIALSDGIKSVGGVDIDINPKPPIPRGSRLTPERLAIMKIGTGFLLQLFIDILYKYEGAIVFDDSEMRLLWPEIEPSVVIHTIPHEPWQQQNIRPSYAMKEAAAKIVKKKLASGLLEWSQGAYHIDWLIKSIILVSRSSPHKWIYDRCLSYSEYVLEGSPNEETDYKCNVLAYRDQRWVMYLAATTYQPTIVGIYQL